MYHIPKEPFALLDLKKFLYDHYFKSILPFWNKYAIDPAGGINTCIQDNGTLASREKWLWSQWRAIWVFSYLYNHFGQQKGYLEKALAIYQFITRHGWNETEQGWNLTIDWDGTVLREYECIYVDGFAIYGLTELYRATQDKTVLKLACRTGDAVIHKLTQLEQYTLPQWPYYTPYASRAHGINMIFSYFFWELYKITQNKGYRKVSTDLSNEIYDHFYSPEKNVILERIHQDGQSLSDSHGSTVIPGHVIENMWFQIHIAQDQGNDQRIQQSIAIIKRHLELGWDKEQEGLFLAIDADDRQDIAWDFPESKLWWPHTEALYALLLCYEINHEDWCLEWYRKIHNYSFQNYPVKKYGEWRQKLDRYAKPINSSTSQNIALPVKDPFHLPRALMLSIQCLERITSS